MNTPALTAKAVFDRAHEITSPAERKAYLDQACAGAPEIRQKVEALLQAYEEAGSSFLSPASPLGDTGPYQPGGDTPGQSPGTEPETVDTLPPTDHQPRTEGLGTHIGPYRLVEPLGEGGMGAVYLAEQEQPIRRQVALKIIKPGMDSAQIVARFEAERQALTLMSHDNIARVFDAGTTAMGRPYFVMELVQGIPLTRFCNENTLTPRQRLELFVPVCQAIQHAHQKGIMHRDLKPSNVLIALQDGKPVPKVIDFGLAKPTERPLTDHPQLTQPGTIAGTPEYMSPEQADPGPEGVDTRTDVYSLGVMLYELLTGTTPLDRPTLRGLGLIDLVLRIKEEVPPKPSARVAALGERLAKVTAQRKTEPARLAKLLRGELDWVVLKALEKDRDRRYETASGLAKDVQRYLDDEPVEACPPSARYRLGKFARRHRTLLATAAGFVALLLLGVAGLTAGIVRENQLRQRATKAETKARDALNMTSGVIQTVTRNRTRLGEGERTILRKVLPTYRQFLSEVEPGASPEARATAAVTQFREAGFSALLGERTEAEAGYQRAIALYEKLANDFKDKAEYRSELARCHFDLAYLLNEQGQRPEAEAAYRRAIDLLEQLSADFPGEAAYKGDLGDAYNNLGVFLREGRELAKAERIYLQAIALGEKVAAEWPGPEHRIDLAASYHNLGNAVRDQDNAAAALAWYGKAIALLAPLEPRPDDATLFLRNAYWDRANALGKLRRHAEAIRDWQRVIDLEGVPLQDHLRLFRATAEVEDNLQAQGVPAGKALYEAAAVHARATAAAEATNEAGLQKDYGQRALELLKQARDAGWFRDPQRIKQLKADKAFAPLPRDDFKAFLESLEAGKGANDAPEKK